MEIVCDYNKCTGCGLCSNVCHKGAISMLEKGEHGHFKPVINQDKCVDCHLCQKNCPALLEEEFHQNIVTYVAWMIDDEKREGSSSGGVASSLYETALKQHYYIVGTYLDSQFRAKMELTNNQERIRDFKSSKYIQVSTGDIYSRTVEKLKENVKVLFVGSPCQCAAMRNIANSYNDNLITVELVCHGTPAQKIFLEYLKLRGKKHSIDSVSFRSIKGEELTLRSNNKILWSHTMREDEYLYAFNYGLLHNDSCYSCKYARPERASDLTIGDFWKIGLEIPFNKPKCRVSFIGVNTKKGKLFLEQCKNLHLEEREYKEALVGNPNLRQPSKKHEDYLIFWSEYKKAGLENAFEKTIGPSIRKFRFKRNVEKNLKGIIKSIFHMK